MDGRTMVGRARRFAQAGTLLLAVMTAGCDADTPAEEVSPPPYATLGGPPPSGATGCNSERWIGAKTTSSVCPPVAGWIDAPLFAPPAPAGLADDCEYTWGNPTVPPTAADVATMQAALSTAGVVALTEDCVIIGPLGDEATINEVARPWLRDAALAGAGALPSLPPSRNRTSIRVAIADTSPTTAPGFIPHGNSDHGFSVGWLAQQIGCPAGALDPSCKTTISSQLALPYISKDVTDDEHGGYFGTPGQAAKAIHTALLAWKSQAPTGDARLVLNLSFGWQPYKDECPIYQSPNVPPPIVGKINKDAIFGALIEASCHGAIIVAAAGNHPGGPSVDPGPTCPAAWEAVRAPTQAECETALGTNYAAGLPAHPLFPAASQSGPPPLVYSVGAVDHTGNTMVTTRPGSLGRLAAIGLHGTGGPSNTELGAPLSGSSVAAALVSGAAAALWSYAPDLTASEIMSLLYDQGTTIPALSPSLRNPAVLATPHRMLLCSALSALCASSPALDCAVPTCPPLPLSSTQNLPIPSEEKDDLWVLIEDFYSSPATDFIAFVPFEAPPPNEVSQGLAVPPWSHPQPLEPTCTGPCVYEIPSKRLMISINPALTGAALKKMALVLRGIDGQTRVLTPSPSLEGESVNLSKGLHAGDRLVLTNIGAEPGFSPRRATLVFESQDLYGNPASVTEEILLAP